MKKSLNILIVSMLFLMLSCTEKSKIKNFFFTHKLEYWSYKDECGSRGIYFKFNNDGSYDKFNRFLNDDFELFNNDGDLRSDLRSWSIKNDSTFTWDKSDLKIETINNNKIILTYYHYKEKNKKCTITLEKVIDKSK